MQIFFFFGQKNNNNKKQHEQVDPVTDAGNILKEMNYIFQRLSKKVTSKNLSEKKRIVNKHISLKEFCIQPRC